MDGVAMRKEPFKVLYREGEGHRPDGSLSHEAWLCPMSFHQSPLTWGGWAALAHIQMAQAVDFFLTS